MTATVDQPATRGLRVAELFGPTLQGEGPSAGQRAVFVRLSGCNLDCGWCDTPYTWDWSRYRETDEAHDLPVAATVDWVLARDADLLVITGGEPLIQHRHLLPLLVAVRAAGRRVEVETNGTIPPPQRLIELVDQFNVSPKLASSGVALRQRIRPTALQAMLASGKAVFKFVITGDADLAELIELQAELGLTKVWVMPEGTTADAVLNGLRRLAGPALAHSWNLTPRLHVLLWGDQRGR